MTPKQKFIETFLKHVYGFNDVEFTGTYSGCMGVKGIYKFHIYVPLRCRLMGEDDVRTESVQLNIWVDKLKNGGHTIKFKTWHNHIPAHMFQTVIGKAMEMVPDAGVDIYNRTHAYSRNADIPTLRLRVSELPW